MESAMATNLFSSVAVKMEYFLLSFLLISYAQASSFRDSRDGEEYSTVKIGQSVWMAENLRYNVRGSRCINDLQKLCGIGRYYNFNMAEQACPGGWHLPSKKEWNSIFEKVDKDFGLFLLGYCYDEGRCFDYDKDAYFWTSSNDWGWVANLKVVKAHVVRYESAKGILLNPSNSFFKDRYYFNVRCVKD